MDLNALHTDELPYLSTIWLDGNYFDEDWLHEAAINVSWTVDRIQSMDFLY